MSCDRARLSAYRDGALDRDQRYEVEEHLRACADCTITLRGYQRLAQTVRSMAPLSVPTSVRHGLLQRIAEGEAAERRGALPRLARALGPAVAAAAMALSVLVVFRPGAGEVSRAPVPGLEPNPVPVAAAVDPPAAQAPVAAPAPTAPVVVPTPAADPAAAPPIVVRDGSSSGTGTQSAERTFGMPRAIMRLYRSNPLLQADLGAPALGSKTVTLIEQAFQGGLAVWRGDTREVYVLNRSAGTWAAYPDSWQPGSLPSIGAPPPGAMAPVGGFAYLWQTRPDVRARLGWAVYEQRGSGGTIQSFDRGIVIWSPHGLLYVLTDDGKWRTYPDPASTAAGAPGR